MTARNDFGIPVSDCPGSSFTRQLGGTFDIGTGDPRVASAIADHLARAAGSSVDLVGPLDGASVTVFGSSLVVTLADGLQLGFEVVARGGRRIRDQELPPITHPV